MPPCLLVSASRTNTAIHLTKELSITEYHVTVIRGRTARLYLAHGRFFTGPSRFLHGEARTSSGRRNPGRHTSSSVAKYAVQHYQSHYKDLPTANSRVKRSTFHYCACPDFPPDSGSIARGRRRLGFITCRGKFVGGCRHVGARRNGHIWDTAGAVDLFPSGTSHRPRLPGES